MSLPWLFKEKSTAETAPLVVFAEGDARVPKFDLDREPLELDNASDGTTPS